MRVLTFSAKRVVVAVGNFSAGEVAVSSISGVVVDVICEVLVGIAGSVVSAGEQETRIESPSMQAVCRILLFGTMNSPSHDAI